MRITELITMLEQVKNEEGDLEIYADTVPLDDAVEEIELAEFGIYTRQYGDEELMIMDIWPEGEQRELL